MDVQKELRSILEEVLGLRGRSAAMDRSSALLGAVPELDSMSVVTLMTTLEERFSFTIADDEVNAATFSTFGTLADFVKAKLSPQKRASH